MAAQPITNIIYFLKMVYIIKMQIKLTQKKVEYVVYLFI